MRKIGIFLKRMDLGKKRRLQDSQKDGVGRLRWRSRVLEALSNALEAAMKTQIPTPLVFGVYQYIDMFALFKILEHSSLQACFVVVMFPVLLC